MTDTTVGEALVGLLEAYGVDTVFGIPGVHNVEMYRALPRSNIRHILPRHEQGAGFMADGYARATGKPGVCFTITGPGLLNILTPMGEAWSDSSNMLVISTALDITDGAQGRGRLHEMRNQRSAAEGVTSVAIRAYTANDVRDGIAQAFANFASARPRPAYLEIPLDVLTMPAGQTWAARPLLARPSPSPALLMQAAEKLNAARQSFIILGGGALEAGDAALAIAEKLGCPVITTTAGKGAIPAAHPLCWGYCLGNPMVQQMLLKADCILAVGTELSETDFWDTQVVIEKNLIRIDIDAAAIARPHVAEVPILGDAGEALAALNKLIALRSNPQSLARPTADETPLQQVLHTVLDTIRKALPDNSIIASDMTQIAYAANVMFPVHKPRTWLHPVGFGTLGFALPAAIGAKFGRPERAVAALVGDYGFQYSSNELATAVEHQLTLPILLWNNNALGQIRDDMVNKGIQPNAVTLRNPDFQLLAKAYGARAEKPENLKALAKAITVAQNADGPTLIEMSEAMARD